MTNEGSGKGVYDTPVHGSREQSVDKVEDALATTKPAAPAPSMEHAIEGSAILVENDSGVAAAESTGLREAHDDVRFSDTSTPRPAKPV